jgi:hypothetical protein
MNQIPIPERLLTTTKRWFDKHMRDLMEQRPEPGYMIYKFPEPITPFILKHYMLTLNSYDGGHSLVSALLTLSRVGHAVPEHRDSKTARPIRWHVPIHTEGTTLINNGVPTVMEEGFMYGPVEPWLPHEVLAPTERERVHLILDFEKDHAQ